jgi:hypothetical protein
MIQFKAGDRVAVYSSEIRSDGEHATVSTVYSGGIITVKMDFGGDKIDVYPQQLRRLKSNKAKNIPAARELWVQYGEDGQWELISDWAVAGRAHMREVLPNTTSLSRADLAKAWAKVLLNTSNLAAAESGVNFREFCKALGMGEK